MLITTCFVTTRSHVQQTGHAPLRFVEHISLLVAASVFPEASGLNPIQLQRHSKWQLYTYYDMRQYRFVP